MRVISQPVFTYSVTLSGSLQQQQTKIIPFFGAIAGLWLDLTVSATDATDAQVSNTIDNVIQQFEIDDAFGKVALQVQGTDLSVLNDALQPRGVRTSPPTFTGDSDGTVTAEWHFYFPYTIAAGDSPAQLKITFNSTSSLENGSLTSAGTVVVTLNVRSAYLVGLDAPTLRVTTSNPFHQAGDNTVGNYLPTGFQEEIFLFTLAGGDGDFGYVTFFQGGGTIAVQQPLHDFTDADTMLMQSGHLSGEFITRYPQILVDNTTMVTINLGTDTAIRLYNIATVPQKQRQ